MGASNIHVSHIIHYTYYFNAPRERLARLKLPHPVPDSHLLHLKVPLGFEQAVTHENLSILLLDPQKRVGGREHAGGGARIPGPAPSPAMAPAVIDIGRLLDGDEAVSRDGFRVGLLQRRDFFVDLEGPRAEMCGELEVAPRARRGGEAHQSGEDPGRAVA